MASIELRGMRQCVHDIAIFDADSFHAALRGIVSRFITIDVQHQISRYSPPQRVCGVMLSCEKRELFGWRRLRSIFSQLIGL